MITKQEEQRDLFGVVIPQPQLGKYARWEDHLFFFRHSLLNFHLMEENKTHPFNMCFFVAILRFPKLGVPQSSSICRWDCSL